MTDISALHSHCMRLILSLREGLEKLEEAESRRSGDTQAKAASLRLSLSELQRTSSELDSVWRMHVVRENANKRDVWKRKVEAVSEEVHVLRMSLDKWGSREQRRLAEQQEREELLSRADAGRRVKQEMDEEAQMAGSVQRSKRAIEEIYEQGNNILVSMAGSREKLKRAHRRVLDVINSVGLGETLLKLIEKRQTTDAWILYGGIILTLLFTAFLMWRFWS